MSEVIDLVAKSIEETHKDKPAATRRHFVKTAAATIGGLGLLGVAGPASARRSSPNSTANILTVATTAEVLATIVNTVGWERNLGVDAVTQRNIRAAAREELLHYRTLRSFGGTPATKKIWVPDAVFASRTNFLNTLQVGDQIFVNAYLIATKRFAQLHKPDYAVIAAEFMGVEAVHRALARQSLGKLGNDRVFIRADNREEAPDAPDKGQLGFNHIGTAVARLQAAGFGFGARGAEPGSFYSFDEVRRRTPDDPDVNTRSPDQIRA
jgi:Ferritin-like domain